MKTREEVFGELAPLLARALARLENRGAMPGAGDPVDVEPDRPGSDAGGRSTACAGQDARAVPPIHRPAARASTSQ